jgi:hypothetical protein
VTHATHQVLDATVTLRELRALSAQKGQEQLHMGTGGFDHAGSDMNRLGADRRKHLVRRQPPNAVLAQQRRHLGARNVGGACRRRSEFEQRQKPAILVHRSKVENLRVIAMDLLAEP